MSLKLRLTLQCGVTAVLFAALIFIPAGSLRFWEGWAYVSIQFVSGLLALVYLYKHDPELVERRMRRKEKVQQQKLIMKFVYVIYLIALLLPGLDHRFGWSHPPLWLIILSQAGALGGSMMTFWVMKVNTFAASTIQVETDQRVISSGPYRFVRHPMYLGLCMVFFFTPLALVSYFALPVFVLLIPLIVLRLLNEEKVLCQELAGYPEYCLYTRFRLVPCLW
jgi:protein-S-isoprenylcysteine O-methyltransferase Ste14